MKKVITKSLITIIAIIILLLQLFCTVGMVSAEEESTLSIIEYTNEDGSITYNIKNVKNYLNQRNRTIGSNMDKSTTVLKALQYSDEEISKMSSEQIYDYTYIEEAYVTQTTAYVQDEYESEHSHMNKLTIWSRVIRTGETIASNDGTCHVYRLIGDVQYDTFTGNGWIPQTREKDIMVFAWSGNNIIVNGSRKGTMICDVIDFWNHGYKYTAYNYLGSSRFIDEYPPLGNGWGVRYDLPNNSPINGYVNFKLTSEIEIAALNNFNFYHEYAHRTIIGDVSVSVGTSGVINIGINGTDVAKAPVIGVFIP